MFSLAITGCRDGDRAGKPGRPLSPDQVRERIAELRKQIIPPRGTPRTDVDAVFGTPKEIKELRGKGSKAHYPMHTYQLLPPRDGLPFRAFLYVTYRDGKVRRAGINHVCAIKGRVGYEIGSPERLREQKEIEAENVNVLAELIEIREKREGRLRGAAWNR